MRQEEEEVDIDGIVEDAPRRQTQPLGWNGDHDEDILWADDEPDDDIRDWKMRIVMEEDLEFV
jgi:COMPASS component SWD1